jgi:hypothetical protein
MGDIKGRIGQPGADRDGFMHLKREMYRLDPIYESDVILESAKRI